MSKTLMQDVAIQDVPAPPGWGGGRFMDVLSSSHMLMSSEASVSLGLAHCQALQIHFWCKKELRKDLGSWTPPQKRGMGNTPSNPSFWLSQRSLQDQLIPLDRLVTGMVTRGDRDAPACISSMHSSMGFCSCRTNPLLPQEKAPLVPLQTTSWRGPGGPPRGVLMLK